MNKWRSAGGLKYIFMISEINLTALAHNRVELATYEGKIGHFIRQFVDENLVE